MVPVTLLSFDTVFKSEFSCVFIEPIEAVFVYLFALQEFVSIFVDGGSERKN